MDLVKIQNKQFDYTVHLGLDQDLKEKMDTFYGIDELDIEDVFTDTQLSKIEYKNNYLYICLQFPEFDKTIRQFIIKETHIFVAPKFLLLIDKDESRFINQFNDIKDKIITDDDITSFELFYEIFDFIVTKLTQVIFKFKKEIAVIENEIFNFKTQQDLLKEILIIKRNLINFESVILPIQTLIVDLETKKNVFITNVEIELLDDTLDKVKKLINNLQNFKGQMELITDTNEVLIARNTNEIIKALTSVNIIVLAPTVIASFFGMNIYFGWDPMVSNYLALILIVLLIVSCTAILLWYFKKKGWV
jgi:magnesium transporter